MGQDGRSADDGALLGRDGYGERNGEVAPDVDWKTDRTIGKAGLRQRKTVLKGNPTAKELIVADQRDFRREQEQLKLKIRKFHEGGEGNCTQHPHPFFGALTPYEWSRGMYKHLDHHLRQFGA
jgi:hypothetical protein